MKLLQLKGPETQLKSTPECCKACGYKNLYKQPDFNKSIGIFFVGLASIATCVLFYFKFNWFVVWSPMLFVLIIDFFFSKTQPNVLLCYSCGTIHRGLSEDIVKDFEAFDLEEFDRTQYKLANEEENSSET